MESGSPQSNKKHINAQEAAFRIQRKLLENFVAMARSSVNEEMLKATLGQTLDVSVELSGAETGSLFLLDSEGIVIDSILTRYETDQSQRSKLIGSVLDKGLAGWVRRNLRVGLIKDTKEDNRWLTLPNQPYTVRSALAIPILRAEELIGIITLLHSEPDIFSDEIAELMRITSVQIALVLENTRLYSKLTKSYKSLDRAKKEIEEYSKALNNELEKGRKIQRDFLPNEILQISGWRISNCFYPAKQVSGDFYDVFLLEGGYIGLVIADVCDKGVGAALYMALFRSLIRIFSGQTDFFREYLNIDSTVSISSVDELSADKVESSRIKDPDLSRAMRSILLTNNYIAQNHGEEGMFATIFFGVLDPKTGALTYINGGHEPPLIIASSGIRKIIRPTGPAVGLYYDAKFHVNKIQIEPGDILIGYTDGVTEARSPNDELFTKGRLESFIENSGESVCDFLDRIKDHLFSFINNADQSDDITMLAVYRESK